MGNNTPDSKLDETVKNTLNNYEAPYDASDWSRMESMLDTAPKSTGFKWSKSLSIFIGIAVLAGGFLIFKALKTSKTDQETKTEITQPVESTPSAKVITKTPPAVTKTTPPPVETPKTEVSAPAPPPVQTNTTVASGTKATVVATTTTPTEKVKADKKKKEEDSDLATKNQKVSVMGNEPVFGDMIDSSKGIIRETKEKENTKKAAKTQTTNSGIGLNAILNINADSIRKQKERMQKDTLKNH